MMCVVTLMQEIRGTVSGLNFVRFFVPIFHLKLSNYIPLSIQT